MVQVDDDDQETLDLIKAGGFDARVVFNVAPREDTVAAKWNRALQQDADVYTCMGDDDPLMTPQADEKILHAAGLFPDGVGVVYGHLANASFSGVISFTKRMTDWLGYIQPEFFPFWFCDHWTDDIARMTGRIAFADVRSDQSRAGLTQERRETGWWATWFDANYMVRRNHADRIIEQLDEPGWRKEILHSHAPLIEFRSRWINDNVRMNARNFDLFELKKPERYLRVKQKAIDAMPGILVTLPEREAAIFREALTPPPTITNIPRIWAAA
jgi:hypothetical protein